MIAALLLLGGSPSITAADQPAAANAEVKIDNFSFGRQTVTVPVGATVTWTNRDDIPHTVVSTDGVFKSKVGCPLPADKELAAPANMNQQRTAENVRMSTRKS
jgi:plastocyanin